MRYLALILVLFSCLPSFALTEEEENRIACKVYSIKAAVDRCLKTHDMGNKKEFDNCFKMFYSTLYLRCNEWIKGQIPEAWH